MARILLVGTVTLDLVFELDHHPGADEEMRAHSLRICRGGNAANTAVVLSRLGHQAEFLGVLADAPETAVIERDFSAHGVMYAQCPRFPGRPPTSSIYLNEGNRSIVHYRDLPELDARHLREVDLSRYDWVHFEGRNVEALVDMVGDIRNRTPLLPISLELEKPRPGIEALFGYPDLLICSRGFSLHHGLEVPQDFLQWMSACAPQATVVAAWGAAGAYGLAPGGPICHAPANELTEIIDTLGAGDTFNAGLLDAGTRTWALDRALVHACALAGKKCGVHGFDI
jgi:ketohexokinase